MSTSILSLDSSPMIRQRPTLWYGRLLRLCAVLIGLPACQTSASQVPRTNVKGRMHDLAARYVHDEETGMTGVIADLQNCYASASRFRIKRSALRDCLILDTVAFYEDSRFD